MTKIALVLPYFGEFPNYFHLFLHSCRQNPSIDWLLFTDCNKPYDYPGNVKVISTSFADFRGLFQRKFDFEITLDTPYKLCDYKPAYGYLLEEYLNGYDFWGYCDLDLLFGDIRSFLPDEQLRNYDKVGHLGHLSLYRNTPEINTLFMAEIDGRMRYREVFSTNAICVFDEWDGLCINQIFLRSGKTLWLWNAFFDAYPYDDNLVKVTRLVDLENNCSWTQELGHANTFITWENGRVYANTKKSGVWKKEELAYVHFQKRAMAMNCAPDEEQILCLPNQFIPLREKIPHKYITWSVLHRFINLKRWKQQYRIIRYRLIVLTAPIRHKFRKH